MFAKAVMAIGVLLAAVLSAAPASARDPLLKPGVYAGAFAGWVSLQSGPEATAGERPITGQTVTSVSQAIQTVVNGGASTFSGGAVVGYGLGDNWLQLGTNTFVLAIEADAAGGGTPTSQSGNGGAYSATYSGGAVTSITSTSTATKTSSLDFDSSVRALVSARLTYGLRLFGTAGLAIGRVSHAATINKIDVVNGVPQAVQVATGSVSRWSPGWTAGAGILASLGGAWMLRAEYRYLDLGTTKLDVKFSDGSVTRLKFTDDEHTIRVGLVYHFDT